MLKSLLNWSYVSTFTVHPINFNISIIRHNNLSIFRNNNICFDDLRPSQQIFSHIGTISCLPGIEWDNFLSSWGSMSTKQPTKCLAQGHNTVTPSVESPNSTL